MKVSTREMMLLWVTGMVALFGVTYMLAVPRIKEWKDLADRQQKALRGIEVTERLIAQKPQWQKKLADFRKRLPQYPPDKDVTADLLIRIEKLASANGIQMPARDSEKEVLKGDMYELAVNCKWEGKLDSLVHFLFDLQNEDAILDASQLTVAPNEKRVLRGSFTVYCSYSRTSSGGPAKKPEPKGQTK